MKTTMSKQKSLFIILFLLQSLLVYSQRSIGVIQGEVKDSESRPIPYANVYIKGSTFGTNTNETGVFSLRNVPLGEVRLVISAVGYETYEQTLNLTQGTLRISIQLQSGSTELSEIVISAPKIQSYRTLNRIDVPANQIPLTTSAVSREVMIERNVDNLGEALKSVSGVRPMDTYGGFQTFTIRGFNNFLIMVDGVRDERHNISQSAPTSNLANVESIEVLKGPASVLFGHSALGGVINISRKQPSYDFEGELSATVGSFDTRRIQAGFGGPINDKLRYRLDFGMSETEGFRGEGYRTNNAYFAMDYQPTAYDLIQFKFQANKDHYNTDAGLPVLPDGSLHPQMDRRQRYNAPDDRLLHERYDFQLRYERSFKNGMLLSNTLSYYDDDINYLSSEELTLNAQANTVRRSFTLFFNHETKPLQNQLELSNTYRTGNIEQKLLIGYALSVMDRKTFRGPVTGPGVGATLPVLNPSLNQGALMVTPTNYLARMEAFDGFYFQDWISFSPKLKGLVGARFDIFNGEYYTNQIDANRKVTQEGDKINFQVNAFTWRAGLVYNLTENWNLYGSHSTYFKPTRTVSVNGDVFDPESGYQTEIGTRVDLNDRINMTLSAYQMVRTNILENLGAGNFRNIGEGSSKGFELDVEAKASKNLSFSMGYSFTEATIRDNKDGAFPNPRAGNVLPFAPRSAVNSWAVYRVDRGVLQGLSFNLGYFYNAETYTNAANTYKLPAYGLADFAIAYQARNSQIRLNINNITDVDYFSNAIYGNQWVVGAPRNLMLSFRTRF
jgi:iron complex outermembrane recepter protein